MRQLPTHISTLHALILSLLLVGCGQLDLLPGGGDGNGGGNDGSSSLGLCSSADTGPDSDGNGLSDACELQMGLDPNINDADGNGIDDNNELPPGMTVEQAQQESWWNGFVQQLMSQHQAGNLLTGSFFQKEAPLGTQVTVTAQTLEFFIDGQGDGNADNYNFCHNSGYASGNNYMYFYISGSVKVCDNCALETSFMKLCGVLDNPTSAVDSEYTQTFKWHIAQTIQGTFNPEIMPRGDGNPSVSITPLSTFNDAPLTVKKVKVKFDTKYTISGSANNQVTGENTQIETETISVFRTFKRVGGYDDQDRLNGRYTRDELDSIF